MLCILNVWFKLQDYVDRDKKNSTRYVITLGDGAVSWITRLLKLVALSTTETEYVAKYQGKEKIWLQSFLEELGGFHFRATQLGDY